MPPGRRSGTSTRSSTTPRGQRPEASSSSTRTNGTTCSPSTSAVRSSACRWSGGSMRERGRGRIVNVSSDAAFTGPGAMGAHYAASKAGLLALTRRAAAELAASGVTVNAVAPGALDGETVHELAPDLDAAAAAIPVGRLGREEEVASLVALAPLRRRGLRHRRDVPDRRRCDALKRRTWLGTWLQPRPGSSYDSPTCSAAPRSRSAASSRSGSPRARRRAPSPARAGRGRRAAA